MSTKNEIETQILNPLFDSKFNGIHFYNFLKQLFPDINLKRLENATSIYLRNEYKEFVESAHQIGSYNGNSDNIKDSILIYVIKLKKSDSILRARTMQRNLIGRYLQDKQRNAALVAFYEENSPDWRFSFVKMEQKLIRDKNNNLASETILSSPKRHSFLVGGERNHTCKSRFLELMSKNISPSLKDIEEVFNVETVTDEFFEEYNDYILN